jgi:hypothetical protein
MHVVWLIGAGDMMDSLTIVSERSGQENIFRPIGP